MNNSDGLDAPTFGEAMARRNQAAHGIGGRPSIPEEDRRRSVGVSMSPETLGVLESIQNESGKSRSEIVEEAVLSRFAAYRGAIATMLGLTAGELPAATLSEPQLQVVASICSTAVEAWSAGRNASIDETTAAITAFFRAAANAVQASG